jgi:hypothetical protein
MKHCISALLLASITRMCLPNTDMTSRNESEIRLDEYPYSTGMSESHG